MIKIYRGSQVSESDIDEIVRLSKRVYQKKFLLPAHTLKSWHKINPDIFLAAKDDKADNKLVGYLVSIPLRKKIYDYTFNADFDEGEIPLEDILRYDKESEFFLHFGSLAIEPSASFSPQIYKKLMIGFVDLMQELQEKNIFMKEASAHSVSGEGDKTCSFLQMRCAKNFDDGTKIFTSPNIPLAISFLSKSGKKLYTGYRNRALAKKRSENVLIPLLQKSTRFTRWRAIFISAAMLTATLLLWSVAVTREHTRMEMKTQFAAENVKRHIEINLAARIKAITSLAKRVESNEELTGEEWESEAKLIVKNLPGFGVEMIDTENRVLWTSVPSPKKERLVNENVSFDKQRQLALETAKARHDIVFSHPTDMFLSGKRGFLAIYPIFRDGKYQGSIIGAFRFEKLFNILLTPKISPEINLSLTDGEEEIHLRKDSIEIAESRWIHKMNISLHGVTWQLTVWPNQNLINQAHPFVPITVMVFGFLITALLIFITYPSRKEREDISSQLPTILTNR